MTEEIIKPKNIYHIAFSFAEPRPGVITVPADSPEEAKDLLLKMAKDMVNVEVHEIVDSKDIPDFQKAIANKMIADQQVADNETKDLDDEDKKVIN